MMLRVGHRPASQTRCRSATDAAVAPPAVTPNRTIATCCEAVVRKIQDQPPRSPLRPTKTKGSNTHSVRGTATSQPPAGSFPAGFRTPAPVPAAPSVTAGIRNPQHIQTQVPGNIGGRTEADFDFCPQAAVAEMFVDCGAVHRGAVVSPRRLEAARRCSCYNGSCYAAALSAAARFRAQYARMRCA